MMNQTLSKLSSPHEVKPALPTKPQEFHFKTDQRIKGPQLPSTEEMILKQIEAEKTQLA